MTESYGTTGFSLDDSGQPDFGPSGDISPVRWRGSDRCEDARQAVLKAAIGHEVRSLRLGFGMNLLELAASAGISASMLCKVERGSISPSLDTLQALSSALQVPLTRLFRGFERENRAVLIKAGDGAGIERAGTGFQHKLLRHVSSQPSGVAVELRLITLSQPSDAFPTFRHEGLELLYLLEGEIIYRQGGALYQMAPGDCLFLETGEPHEPHELVQLPVRILALVSYRAG